MLLVKLWEAENVCTQREGNQVFVLHDEKKSH